jgi:thiosulfate/3-mercaptopyruvate sulfurtransferase
MIEDRMKLHYRTIVVSIVLIALSFSCLVAQNDKQKESRIVTAEWLSNHLNDKDIIILQVSMLRGEYLKEHIEGSRFLWTGWLSGSTPDASIEALPVTEIKTNLQKLGVSNKSKIIISFAGANVIAACRAYLMLDYIGLGNQTYILNGGLEAWKTAGYKVTAEIKPYKKSRFSPKVKKEVFVNAEWILKNHADPNTLIIDARAASVYEGKGTVPRAGHIPDAKNLPFTNLYDEKTYKFHDDDKLSGLFNKLEASADKHLAVYCAIGNSASTLYFIAKQLGYNVSLYDGSMEEWGNRIDFPLEKSK